MLAVRDLVASTQWYRDALGFELVFEMPGPTGSPVLSHLRWAKYADLLLTPDGSATTDPKGVGVTLNFAMGNRSIDEFSDRIVKQWGDHTTGPMDQPWNARELTVLDLDGYRITFTQPINTNLSIDNVANNVSQPAP